MEPWLERFAQANFRRSADTAHDLKTPLNVAVLNLELLRMRIRKLTGEDDTKLSEYAQAIDLELRRMGRIFDAFFLLSTPPRGDEQPPRIDAAAIAGDEASATGISLTGNGRAEIAAHESRIRQAIRLFFEGAAKLIHEEGRQASTSSGDGVYAINITGQLRSDELELTKIFKFYYTDADGSPDLSLAVARLIAETYGGELSAVEEDRDTVILRLSFPLGAR
jgi:nitrogen fixation/metabolism regulation signal transduction histidine kinase